MQHLRVVRHHRREPFGDAPDFALFALDQRNLPAVTQLVSEHFRRVLLETAEEHIEDPP